MEMGKKPAKRLLPRIGDRNPTRLVSLSLFFSAVGRRLVDRIDRV